MKQDYLCKLAEISLNIANVVDRQGANDDCSLADSLGMGYRALSSYLRQGVKAIVDIQERCTGAFESSNFQLRICRSRKYPSKAHGTSSRTYSTTKK